MGLCMAAVEAAWLGVPRVVATATVVTVSIVAAAPAGSMGKVAARRVAGGRCDVGRATWLARGCNLGAMGRGGGAIPGWASVADSSCGRV